MAMIQEKRSKPILQHDCPSCFRPVFCLGLKKQPCQEIGLLGPKKWHCPLLDYWGDCLYCQRNQIIENYTILQNCIEFYLVIDNN